MAKKTPRYQSSQAYFRGVLANERRIQYLEAEITKQQSRLALNGVEGGEVVSKTMEGDAMEQGFAALYDLCDRLDTELIGYVGEREQAMRVLSSLADSPAFEVMVYRYFEGYRFKDIARLMGYSEDHVFRLHREAMYAAYDSLPIEFKFKRH